MKLMTKKKKIISWASVCCHLSLKLDVLFYNDSVSHWINFQLDSVNFMSISKQWDRQIFMITVYKFYFSTEMHLEKEDTK
jgi:hypothetical protein